MAKRILSAADVHRMQALLNSLRQALGIGISIPGRMMQTSEDNLYEAYLFGLVLRAAEHVGFRIDLRDHDDKPASELLLRHSPGYIYNGTAATQPPRRFSHALLVPPHRRDPLEVHVGINASGFSGVGHEADVMVIPSQTARRCIAASTHPDGSDLVIHLEAKCYARRVDVSVGRQFVGMACDLKTPFSILIAPLMDANAQLLADAAPHHPGIQGRGLVRPRHAGEAALFDELARALRGHLIGSPYP